MIFYKITQSKNSLSKEGETLYYAKTIITGKTDFNELCDKVNKLSKIDKSVAFLAECENGVWLTHFLPSDTFLRNVVCIKKSSLSDKIILSDIASDFYNHINRGVSLKDIVEGM